MDAPRLPDPSSVTHGTNSIRSAEATASHAARSQRHTRAVAAMSSGTDAEPRVGDRYRSSRLRLSALLEPLDERGWVTPVPACPGWRVRDVVAHLVGVIEDAAAGRITGPPDPVQTAAEVDRHRDDDPLELLRRWSTIAPTFESAISDGSRWPALIDALSHEHDIRGALASPDHRDHRDLLRAADLLTGGLPDGLVVELDGEAHHDPSAALRLRTDHFEFFRLRLGRRSRQQVARLDWSADPGPVLDRLFVFGPAANDIDE